jgi:hypothetical protein
MSGILRTRARVLLALVIAAVSIVALGAVGARPAAAATTPTITVSQTAFFNLGAGSTTVTVTGSGFDPAANVGTRPPLSNQPSGVYVTFGRFADVWRPSVGAPSSSRTNVIDQKWAVPQAAMTLLNPMGTNPAYVLLNADGTFTTTLTISKNDAMVGNYGVYTYPGSGASNAAQETYTPIAFDPTPSVKVSKTNIFNVTGAGEVVTVTGSGFDPAANLATTPPLPNGTPAGFYVVFGRFADVWKPFDGAPPEARQQIVTKWVLPQASRDVAPGGGAGDTFATLSSSGTFSVTITITKDEDLTGSYGIATYASGPTPNSIQETFTPITFIDQVPTVSVSQTTFTDLGDGTATVTVEGKGFDSLANVGTRPPLPNLPAGVYVVFGRFADVWQPSAGAGAATRAVIDQKWALPASSRAILDPTGTTPAYATINPDGTFSTSLTVKIDDTKTGNYGVATYAAGGAAANAAQETFTPITFVDTPVTPEAAAFVELSSPARLLDTRPGAPTFDNEFAGQGIRTAGSILELQVAGRAGVASDAASVAVNVTATGSTGPGYVTAWPCGQTQPGTSTLNLAADITVANAAIVQLGADGKVCLAVAEADTHLIVDLAGVAGQGFGAVAPTRLVDTREQPGVHPVGQVIAVPVAGTAGVPPDAAAAVLNVTATDAAGIGYVTVWPCDAVQPNASNLNSVPGRAVAGAVVATLAADGTVCVAVGQSDAEVIVDVVGYVAAGTDYEALVPARILDTRAGGSTVDGEGVGVGPIVAGQLVVAGRGGVPLDAAAVVINVTADGAAGPGYVTVWNCDEPQPGTSNLNLSGPDPVANSAIVELSAAGTVCLAVGSTSTNLIVDVAGVVGAVA